MDKFEGFSKKGIRFLSDLKKHNDRDWFRERKQVYDSEVRDSMAALVTEAASLCRQRGFSIYCKEKNPVMRVYRDIRFSPDKRPFKTHVGASLYQRASASSPGEIYIHISPVESFLAAGYWMPERPFLHVWRQQMVAAPKAFESVVKALKRHGLEFLDQYSLKKLPRGYPAQAGTAIEPHLKLTSYVTSRKLALDDVLSPSLVEAVARFAMDARPLLEFGWALHYSPRKDILDEA